MTNWREIPKTADGYRAPPATNSVRISRSGAVNQLVVSGDLVSGPRCRVLTDGNGRLALEFCRAGGVKAIKTGRQSAIPLRKAASEMFPRKSQAVRFTREGGLIVIDTAQFAA